MTRTSVLAIAALTAAALGAGVWLAYRNRKRLNAAKPRRVLP